jgi:Flp pilus assembly protein TadD
MASPGTSFLKLVWEKVPLFALVAVSSLATLLAQQRAVASWEGLPLSIRIANSLVAYVAYIGKTIWPSGLAVFYPHPLSTLPVWKVAGAGLLLAGVSCLVLLRARRQPYLAVGWLWYLGTLVPVIGVVQVGAQSMADRYMYVPLIGLAIMISWGIPDLVTRWRIQRIALPLSAATVLAALMIVTWSQLGHWHDSVALFQRALDVTDNNYVAHSSLGSALAERGKIAEAIDHLSQAIRIKPSYSQGHYSLGFTLAGQGRNVEAIAHFSEALRIRPDYAEAHNNLGVLLAGQGKIAAAIADFSEALRLKPDYPDAHNNLGSLLAGEGKSAEAIAHFSEALRLKPGHAEARNNLERALDASKQGHPGSLPQKP